MGPGGKGESPPASLGEALRAGKAKEEGEEEEEKPETGYRIPEREADTRESGFIR